MTFFAQNNYKGTAFCLIGTSKGGSHVKCQSNLDYNCTHSCQHPLVQLAVSHHFRSIKLGQNHKATKCQPIRWKHHIFKFSSVINPNQVICIWFFYLLSFFPLTHPSEKIPVTISEHEQVCALALDKAAKVLWFGLSRFMIHFVNSLQVSPLNEILVCQVAMQTLSYWSWWI